MPRELRISAVITLPDDKWQEAAALVEAKPLLDKLRADFPNADVTDEIVTPKPRGTKAEENQRTLQEAAESTYRDAARNAYAGPMPT